MWSPFFLFARLLFVGCSEALVSFLSLSDSEQKRRLKAEKKAAEKEAKVKEQQQEQKDSNDKDLQNAGGDEETLDPNVRFFSLITFMLSLEFYSILPNTEISLQNIKWMEEENVYISFLSFDFPRPLNWARAHSESFLDLDGLK